MGRGLGRDEGGVGAKIWERSVWRNRRRRRVFDDGDDDVGDDGNESMLFFLKLVLARQLPLPNMARIPLAGPLSAGALYGSRRTD